MVIFLAGTSFLPGQQTAAEQEREVDAVMKQQMYARRIPGASIAVVSQGKVVLNKGYGLADVEHSVEATEDTVYELASVTKQFTGTAIMILVQDGKLSLDDKLTRVVANLPQAWDTVTIRQLLNHTSGIPDFGKKLDFKTDLRKDYTERQIVELVANSPLDFRPGERFSYSNTGYFLLGMIIEKKSGMTYGDFLRDRIFQPLGMTSTRFNDRRAVVRHRARGYILDGATLRNADYVNPAIPFAAGGLTSSAADMARWVMAPKSEQLLKPANWEEMWTSGKLNDGTVIGYGFGWNIRSRGNRKRVEHAGEIQGFSNNATYFIDGDLAIVVLTNLEGANAPRIAAGISGVYLPETRFRPSAPIADTDRATTEFLRRVATALSQGTGEPDWYTPAVQQYYFPDRIKERKLTFGAFGAVTSFELIGDEKKTDERIRSYRVVLGETPFRFSFRVTKEGKVGSVDAQPE